MHPGNVPFQGVNFAVVRDVAVGMGELPTRKSVGREALVYQPQRTGRVRIRKIPVETCDLRGEEQALVKDGAGREIGNIKEFLILDFRFCSLLLVSLAHMV